MNRERELIGIAGQPASGKDTVGDILRDEFGFRHISSSDLLRRHIAQNQPGIQSRENLTAAAQKIRAQLGAEYLVRCCVEACVDDERIAISGVYSPAETIWLKSIGGAVVSVVCPDPAIRFQRQVIRRAERDGLSKSEFQAAEIAENSGSFDQQNISHVEVLSDALIYNDSDYATLIARVASVYTRLRTGAP